MKILDQRTYNTLTAVLFAVIAAAHLLRIVFGWPVQLADWHVPLWLSWLALIVSGTLAWLGFRHNRRNGSAG